MLRMTPGVSANPPPSSGAGQNGSAQGVSAPKGESSGKGGMTPLEARSQQQAKLSQKRSESYAHIYGHEQAHQSAAGGFGGGIHIDYDANGIAVSGHVPISIPGLTVDSAEQRVSDFQQIRAAALAPQDPSGADTSIASKASSLIAKAQSMAGKKQAMMAKNGGMALTGEQKQQIGGGLNLIG